MYIITVDVSGPLATITGMLEKVNHFKRVDIGAELSAWQTEDMHRHRPFTMRSRAKGRATTVVRPHSLFEVQRSIRARSGASRLAKLQAKPRKRAYRGQLLEFSSYRGRYSTRPILREELLQGLTARMNTALHEKLVWKKKDST
jgi:hypothetical protein